MIADRHTGIETKASLNGDKIAMSIDQAAMSHIMRIMTDLYSDQELACIREYSTNAYDAHIEAGITRPIEVDLPGPLSPFLTIRDYGVGLTVDDIHDIYSKYGASTKRSSNLVQGMLGLGCKSALTYTPQFTVTSVKDGTRVQVAVTREDDGSGSMTVVDTSATNDGNGTTVQIPVRRDNHMETKARLFFSFWEAGTVLVNGKAPERVSGLPVGDNMIVIEAPKDDYGYRSEAKSYVVMGKVAYPARFPNIELSRGYGLVAFVPIGAVNFAPSREGLLDQDPKTTATLKEVAADFKTLAPGAIQKQIDKETSAQKALQTMISFSALLPGARRWAYTFKGKPLPASYRFSGSDNAQLSARNSSALSTCSPVWDYDAASWPNTLWCENHDGTKFTPTHKKKLLQWCAENKLDGLQRFVMLSGKVPAEIRSYVDPARIIDWADDVKTIKLPTVTSYSGYSRLPTKKISGSYGMWTDGDYDDERLASDIDTRYPIYFMRGSRYEAAAYADVLTKFNPKCTVVHMGENRLAKFKRDFPKATEARDAAQIAYRAWVRRIRANADLVEALAQADCTAREFFSKLDMLTVNDPAIKRAIRLAKMDLTDVLKERKLLSYIYGRPTDMPWNERYNSPTAAYPLMKWGRTDDQTTIDHLYIYVNAVYAAKKGA